MPKVAANMKSLIQFYTESIKKLNQSKDIDNILAPKKII